MNFRDLVAWQKSMELTAAIYRATLHYPSEEKYGLVSQLRRAAVSIPSNIAEGQGRRSTDEELIRFLQISLGSLAELETQIELSCRLGFLTVEQSQALRPDMNEVGRLLNGLIRSKRR